MIPAWLLALCAAVPIASGQQQNETLQYTVNWPSGLSLGDARLSSSHAGGGWRGEFVLNAAVPGFAVGDTFGSIASGDYCSREFTKEAAHGKRKATERTVFDAGHGVAIRQTVGGGKSEMPISGCARDAVAFLFYLRHELAQGRLPPPQTVYFGAPYQVRLEYAGTRSIRANGQPYTADRIVVSAKGKASERSFELFFARDSVRTPVLFRMPIDAATFTMELAAP